MASSAAALDDSLYRYGSRQPGLWRSAALAAAVHLALIGVLFFGVRMQSHSPEVVTVELWEPPPPLPTPAPKPVAEAPKPPPAPKAEPMPEIKKPDIAIQEKPKPKPKPKPNVEKSAPRRDVEFEKRMKEQLAMEQKQLQEESRAAAQARQERELEALIARQQQAAADRALATWTDKIRAKIRGNIIYDLSRVPGNPEAIFDVTLLPTGEVLTVNKRKSSGNPGYDDAVERAIRKSSPLPRPDPTSLFRRQLELRFHPLD